MTSLPTYPTDQLQQSNPGAMPGEAEGALGRMRSSLEGARRRLPELQDRAREELYRADDYVRLHPYQALGVAALIGAALGFLLTRRY